MTPEFDPAVAAKLIAMARRFQPDAIARELCSIQPIDFATSFGALITAAQAVGYVELGCPEGCSVLNGPRFEYEVVLPADHSALTKTAEVVAWAVENLGGSFTYGQRRCYTDAVTKLTYTTAWLWRFERLEDSTLFLCAWR